MSLLWLVACGNEGDLHVRREPPVVEITTPADGEEHRQGEPLLPLAGLVSDLPDAADTLMIQWCVDDINIGNDPANADGDVVDTLDLMTVTPGLHTIRLDATDSDDNLSSAEISLNILAAASAPVVDITAPDDGTQVDFDTALTFTGTATDANDPPDALVFAWTSSIDGPIAGASSAGGLSFVTATLSPGTHTVTLSVTDTDGEVGTDAIDVTIGPEQPVEAQPGDVIFSELMINPTAVEDDQGEWVELYNTGDTTLDIGGYSFHDLDFDQFDLQGSIPVAPHDYVVLCANTDPAQNGGITTCDAWFERLTVGGLALANGPDEVVLSRPDGTEIDRLVYDDTWYDIGYAIGLDPDMMDGVQNDDLANWCDQVTPLSGGDFGTPGLENDPC